MAEEELISLNSLLHCLIKCSEKACSIAYICRKDEELFQLLIEEKPDSQKNKRFIQDFKTLADVLIQETVRWEISKKFPAIKSNVFGEENNSFKNTLGETITVQVLDSEDSTITLLSKVLNGRQSAASALAYCVYKDISFDFHFKMSDTYMPAKNIGIWIDPIDSTGEYVKANAAIDATDDVLQSSLKCVTVLIGVFNIETQHPILGIINQPFHALTSKNEWKNHLYWGICYNEHIESSLPSSVIKRSRKVIVASSSEDKSILDILKKEYDVYFISGAGYKCLLVARGEADLYILSRPSTFFWDTCGPQAILAACGGSIVNFKKTVSEENLNKENLKSLHCKYTSEATTKYCNKDGIIAFKDSDILIEFVRFYRNAFYKN